MAPLERTISVLNIFETENWKFLSGVYDKVRCQLFLNIVFLPPVCMQILEVKSE